MKHWTLHSIYHAFLIMPSFHDSLHAPGDVLIALEILPAAGHTATEMLRHRKFSKDAMGDGIVRRETDIGRVIIAAIIKGHWN